MKFSDPVFGEIQRIWKQELGEELTREYVEEHGERLIALVIAVYRSKSFPYSFL